MTNQAGFSDLIRRVRDRDDGAVAEFLGLCSSLVQRSIRVRHRVPGVQSVLSTADVGQEVLLAVVRGIEGKQFVPETPEQLLRLLATMARNELRDQIRHQHAVRRDQRRHLAEGNEALERAAQEQPSPLEVVTTKELLEQVLRLLTPDERTLVTLRRQNYTWEEIAGLVGGSAALVRKRYERALARAREALTTPP